LTRTKAGSGRCVPPGGNFYVASPELEIAVGNQAVSRGQIRMPAPVFYEEQERARQWNQIARRQMASCIKIRIGKKRRRHSALQRENTRRAST
jgi:hypothetical protein